MERVGNSFSALDDNESTEEMDSTELGTVTTPGNTSTVSLLDGNGSNTSLSTFARFTLPSGLGKIQLSRDLTPDSRQPAQVKSGKASNNHADKQRNKPEGPPKGYKNQHSESSEKALVLPQPEFTAKLTDILGNYAAPDESQIGALPSSVRGSSTNKIHDTIWELTKSSKMHHGGSFWAVSGIPTIIPGSNVDPDLILGLERFFEAHFLQISRDVILATFRDPDALYTMDHCTTSTYFFPLKSPTVFSQNGMAIPADD
jgi:hypothetical protein